MRLVGIAGRAGSGKDSIAKFLCQDFGMTRIALADAIKRLLLVVFRFEIHQLWGPSHLRNEVDARYGTDSSRVPDTARIPTDPWGSAWWRLEAYAPGWLRGLRLTEAAMPSLRRWFVGEMFATFGWSWPMCEEADAKPLTPRRLAQTLGTEWGRTQDDRLWIRHLLEQSHRLMTTPGATYTEASGVYVPTHGHVAQVSGVCVPDLRFDNEADAIHDAGGYVMLVDRPGAGLTGEAAAHVSEVPIYPGKVDVEIDNSGTLAELRWRVFDAHECIRQGNRPDLSVWVDAPHDLSRAS